MLGTCQVIYIYVQTTINLVPTVEQSIAWQSVQATMAQRYANSTHLTSTGLVLSVITRETGTSNLDID